MKNYLPYNILLVLAVAACGLAVYYNLVLREDFAVIIRYSLPSPGVVEQEQSGDPGPLYGEDIRQEPAYVFDDYEESVVLVTFPLELNTATLEELIYIPQVGEVTAQRILQYRDVLDGYTDLEQLREISGIGDKTYETISAYLYIEGQWIPPDETDAPED